MNRLFQRYRRAWPILRVVLATIGIAYCVGVLSGVLGYTGVYGGLDTMADGYAYWSADASDPYTGGGLGDLYAYLYSPAFIQVFSPLQLLPWPVFAWGWFGLHLLVLWRLRALWMLAIPLVADDSIRGNVHTFYAYALVAPAWMALPILTKITPGVSLIGERRWRPAIIGVAVAAVIAAISYVLTPDLWSEWIDILRSGVQTQQGLTEFPYPLVVRLPFAIALAIAGRWRPWLLPIAMLVAMPQVWPASFAVLAAIPTLLREQPSAKTEAG